MQNENTKSEQKMEKKREWLRPRGGKREKTESNWGRGEWENVCHTSRDKNEKRGEERQSDEDRKKKGKLRR